MTTAEIKAFFVLHGLRIQDVASAIREERTEVSKVINHKRINQRVRRKLEQKYGISFDTRSSQHQPAA
jgi:antitoxin component HigA of HigAB toxin-antitoxin module